MAGPREYVDEDGVITTVETSIESTLDKVTPHIHSRFKLDRTAKDGWRVSEITVSIDRDFDDPINDTISKTFQIEADMLINTGNRVAEARNRG